MNRLEELEKSRIEADNAFRAAQTAYHNRLNELNRQASLQIEQEDVGKQFRLAQEKQRKLDREWRLERDAVAVRMAEDRLKYPEGTVVVEWNPIRYDWDGVYRPHKTGRKGVLQVFRPGDESNQRYGIDPGNIIVRILKKDGTPGVKVEKFNNLWIKEGDVHPRSKKEDKS